MKRTTARLRADMRGVSYVEYIILVGVVALLAIGAWHRFSAALTTVTTRQATKVRLLQGSDEQPTETAIVAPHVAGEAPQPVETVIVAPHVAGEAPQPVETVIVAPQVAGATVNMAPASIAAFAAVSPAASGAPGGSPANERAQSVTTPLSTASSGLGTRADYSVGPAARPDIHHDNGFLQNPKDPNDPVPQPTRLPTLAEDKAYLTQVFKAQAGVVAVQNHWPKGATPKEYQHFLDLPDGIEMYDHFLTGHGQDYKFSYDKYVQDDPSGKTTLHNAINDTQQGAEQLYREMLAKDPSLAGKPVTFDMTGSPIVVGSPLDPTYPYPASENWQKAIGGHTIWNSAAVTVTPSTVPGDPPKFSMDYTLHGEDRYNFNPGMKDIATGQPDSDNGRFEVTGLAQQFTNYSTLQRDVSWQSGSASSTTQTQSPSR